MSLNLSDINVMNSLINLENQLNNVEITKPICSILTGVKTFLAREHELNEEKTIFTKDFTYSNTSGSIKKLKVEVLFSDIHYKVPNTDTEFKIFYVITQIKSNASGTTASIGGSRIRFESNDSNDGNWQKIAPINVFYGIDTIPVGFNGTLTYSFTVYANVASTPRTNWEVQFGETNPNQTYITLTEVTVV